MKSVDFPWCVGADRAEQRAKPKKRAADLDICLIMTFTTSSIYMRHFQDKTKKASTHQWVSACYGSSHICDVCAKHLSNKPALYCEICGTTVHQNTCKDNILECVSVKIKGAKSTSKLSGFGVPLSSAKNLSSKRGSGSVPNPVSSSTRLKVAQIVSNGTFFANKREIQRAYWKTRYTLHF
ncbi:hypothetical protein D910_08681 [Dendroctonus ponderosae]